MNHQNIFSHLSLRASTFQQPKKKEKRIIKLNSFSSHQCHRIKKMREIKRTTLSSEFENE